MAVKAPASHKGQRLGPQIDAMLAMFTYENIQQGIKARAIMFEPSGMRPSHPGETGSQALAASIVSRAITRRTFARRVKENQTLDPREADTIARLLRVTAFANKVLGDDDMASSWLTQPNPALRNHVPLDMAETDVGAREVETTLKRIAYGDYS